MSFANGCATSGPTNNQPVVIDTACKWVSVIRLHGDDYKNTDIRTLRAIDAHNSAVEKNCPASDKN